MATELKRRRELKCPKLLISEVNSTWCKLRALVRMIWWNRKQDSIEGCGAMKYHARVING